MRLIKVNYIKAVYSDNIFLAQEGFARINSYLCDAVSLIFQIQQIKQSNQMDLN